MNQIGKNPSQWIDFLKKRMLYKDFELVREYADRPDHLMLTRQGYFIHLNHDGTWSLEDSAEAEEEDSRGERT